MAQAAFSRLLGSENRVALAVSGGSDSVALLLLAARARSKLGLELFAATVDHGLRAEARAEAETVAALCATLNVPHHILTWRGAKPTSNLQSAAREARAALLADWRRRIGVRTLALGHTLDDVAETFLLRLARGSGVDGLARMAETREQTELDDGPPLRLIRPLLEVRRSALQAFCRAEGVAWADDPSNEDARYRRVRARALLTALEPLELGPERLAKTAVAMARAREALEAGASALLRDAAVVDHALGVARLNVALLGAAPRELSLRALARALEWVAGAAYPPRLEGLDAALEALIGGGEGRSLHGVLLRSGATPNEAWTLFREPAAMAPALPVENGRAVWDKRFRLCGAPEGATLGPLGEPGRRALEAWAEASAHAPPRGWSAAPVAARAAAPVVRNRAGDVIHAPAAGLEAEGVVLSPLRAPAWESQCDDLGLSVER